jgi:hypothetical protein
MTLCALLTYMTGVATPSLRSTDLHDRSCYPLLLLFPLFFFSLLSFLSLFFLFFSSFLSLLLFLSFLSSLPFLPPKKCQFSPTKERGGDGGSGGSARGDGGRPCALAKGRPLGHEIREAGRRRSNMVAKVPDLGHPPPVDALCSFYFCKNKYKTSSSSSSGPVG